MDLSSVTSGNTGNTTRITRKPQIVSISDSEIAIQGLPKIDLYAPEVHTEISEICYHIKKLFQEGEYHDFLPDAERSSISVTFCLYYYPEHVEHMDSNPESCTVVPDRLKIKFFENYAIKPHWIHHYRLTNQHDKTDTIRRHIWRTYLTQDTKQLSNHRLRIARPMSYADIIYFRSLFVSACAEEIQTFFDAVSHESVKYGREPDYYGLLDL